MERRLVENLFLMQALSGLFRKNVGHVMIFVLSSLSAGAQTNSDVLPNPTVRSSNAASQVVQAEMKESFAKAQRIEQIRATCIEERRRICGKIVKMLPDGI